MKTLALERNVLKKHLQTSATHTHTHTASYQQLPNKIYVEMIVIVTATYLRNTCYHIEEIQKVSRFTTVFSDALNWPSRPNKEKTIVEHMLAHSCMCSVVWVWPDCTCHAQNNLTEAPEVDNQAREAFWS